MSKKTMDQWLKEVELHWVEIMKVNGVEMVPLWQYQEAMKYVRFPTTNAEKAVDDAWEKNR